MRRVVNVLSDAADEEWIARRDALLRLALLLIGNRSAAEDAAAEAMTRYVVVRRRQVINDPDAYLRRTLLNGIIGRGRRSYIEQRHAFRLSRTDEQPDPTAALADSDRLWTALQQLPARQRATLVLRFYEDRSETETGLLLGMPPGTVKSNVSRGLAALRTALGEGDE